MKSLGFRPEHIVDIGANHGKWSRFAADQFPNTQISAFEPQKELASSHIDLDENRNVHLHYKGLGDFDGFAPFTFHEKDDSSSFLYSSDEAASQGFAQSKVEIAKLDSFFANSDLPQPDMIKIDAEGFDLKVLDGGKNTLKNASVVLIEASVANKNYPNTVVEVVTRMESIGFRLFDITDLNRTPQRRLLWLIELVFIKVGSSLDTQGSMYE
ncbi:FkbM family methyltransferase [Rhodobacteraceae bacterium]|nr:FkbM family methyltransferase [Paracoccaceae bacterium]